MPVALTAKDTSRWEPIQPDVLNCSTSDGNLRTWQWFKQLSHRHKPLHIRQVGVVLVVNATPLGSQGAVVGPVRFPWRLIPSSLSPQTPYIVAKAGASYDGTLAAPYAVGTGVAHDDVDGSADQVFRGQIDLSILVDPAVGVDFQIRTGFAFNSTSHRAVILVEE